MIFFGKNIETGLTSNQILKKIEDQCSGVKLTFDYNFTITDLAGCVLNIISEDLSKKRDATQLLLEYIVKNNLDEPEEERKKHTDKISILIMVPNGLVSMIIGTKGKQISNLIRESGADIVVNQPIHKMTYRTCAVSGKPSSVSNAIMNIQAIMEERYYEVSKVEHECRPLNINTTQTYVKFVFNEEAIDYLNSKKGSFINYISENCNVSVRFYQDKHNRQLDRKECIASIKGNIQSVQDAILLIVDKIRNYIRTTFDGKDSFTLKMLINKVYVTKLIGAHGCMIQEIANFSRGASIKIQSTKSDERRSNTQDIVVCIAGSYSAVQDATCIIIEQMECFKKGGPVLKSGKSLNQNIAQQFINSVFCSAERKENQDEHCFTLKERFMSKKRSRSRSEGSHTNSKKYESRNVSREKRVKKGRHEEENNTKNENNYSSGNINTLYNMNQREKRPSPNERRRPNNYHKNDNYYDTKDPSNNISYEDKGTIKISNDIIVPDHLVSLLIGKNGETIRGIMNKSGSMITFQKEHDDLKVNTVDGVAGRLCTIKGTPNQTSSALLLISEMIIKLESSLYGIRKDN